MKTLIKNAKLLDMECGYHYEPLDIMVEGELISAVGKNLGGADVELDMGGRTVMPGVIDAHIHVAVDKGGFSDRVMRAWVKNGVTTVRELGMLNTMGVESFMAFLNEHDTPQCASVVRAGQYIDIVNGYGSGPSAKEVVGIIAATPAEAADAVSYQHEQGVDGIKIGLAGTSPGPDGRVRPEMPPEMVAAICERAHSHGMWVSAHVMECAGFKMLVENGIDDAAHTPADREMPDETVKEAVDKGLMMISTIGNPEQKMPEGFPPEMAEKMAAHMAERRVFILKNLKKFYEAGGVIAIGTDLIHARELDKEAVIPVWELRQLRSIGMPMDEVIKTATINAAKICHIEEREGSVAPGKRANLIAFSGEVDDSFSVFEGLPFVMNRGEVIVNEI